MTSIPESGIVHYERQPTSKDAVWTPTLPRHDCYPPDIVRHSSEYIRGAVSGTALAGRCFWRNELDVFLRDACVRVVAGTPGTCTRVILKVDQTTMLQVGQLSYAGCRSNYPEGSITNA